MKPTLVNKVRVLVEHRRERERMRAEYLAQYCDADGDVPFNSLEEYDEARADANEEAAEDLESLLDTLEILISEEDKR